MARLLVQWGWSVQVMTILFYLPEEPRARLEAAIAAGGIASRVCSTLEEAWAAFLGQAPAVVVVEVPGDSSGLELCWRITAVRPPCPTQVVAVLDHGEDPQPALEAGASDVLELPGEPRHLAARIGLAIGRHRRLSAVAGAEQKVRRAGERFQRLVEMTPDTVLLHAGGELVFVNSAGARLLGAEAPQLLGRRLADFVDPGVPEQRAEPPEDDTGQVVEGELRRIDGEAVDVELVSLPSSYEGRPATQVVIRDVSARKRAEDALRSSEQRYRSLFEGVPVGVYRISSEGSFLEVNRALLEILGFARREDMVDMKSGDLYVDPEDRQAWRVMMEYEGRVDHFETQVYRHDRSTIWVRLSALAIRGEGGEIVGYEGTVEDITDRKRAEDALRRSEERFRSLVQNAPDLISILDAEGTVRYQSPSSVPLLGYSAAEQQGTQGFGRVHPEDRPQLETLFQELLRNPRRSVRCEYRIRHSDGSWRVLESKLTNLLESSSVGGVVINSRDITDRKRAENQLLHDALHDALTGLPNRTLFMDRLGLCLGHSPRHKDYRCAVLFLDLDRFKMVNDSFGHTIGDQLLVQVSRRLGSCLRPTDSLARLGGDEFAILLDNVVDASNAVRVVQRIQQELEVPFRVDGREIYSDASIGIALSSGAGQKPENLLRDADTAMYRAKGRAQASYAIFDARMHAQVRAQLQLETELRRALDQWQFEVFYQPLVAMQTGVLEGFEALLRWRHPERGLVLPDDFVPLAEDTGMINPLGARVLAEACDQMRRWSDRLTLERPLFISVNLSNRQFSQADLVDQVRGTLESSGLAGDRLVLEVTESAVMEDPDTVFATLLELKQLGIQISLDDFGTGYSSLSVLHRFPFDKVKIDRWFVRNVGVDRGSDGLVEGVLALCRWRQLETVAEGVETPEQRRKLAELDCTYAQGFLFSDAVEAARAEELIALPALGVG